MDDPSPCPSRLLASRHRTKSWHFCLSEQEQEPSGLLRLILLAFLSQQRRNAVTQQLMMWMMSFVFEFSKLSHRKEIILMTSFIQFCLAHFRESSLCLFRDSVQEVYCPFLPPGFAPSVSKNGASRALANSPEGHQAQPAPSARASRREFRALFVKCSCVCVICIGRLRTVTL